MPQAQALAHAQALAQALALAHAQTPVCDGDRGGRAPSPLGAGSGAGPRGAGAFSDFVVPLVLATWLVNLTRMRSAASARKA